MLCLYFEWKCTLEWSTNPAPTVYPQKPLSKPCLSPKALNQTIFFTYTENYLQSSQKKVLSRWIGNILTTCYKKKSQYLEQSIALADSQFKELENYVLYFHLALTMRPIFLKYLNLVKLMMIFMHNGNAIACHYRCLCGLFKVIMRDWTK